MNFLSSSDEGPVLHEGGIFFKVEFHPLADEGQVDEMESDEDLISHREAFDRLFGIKPINVSENLEDSKPMHETLYELSRDYLPASHRQNEAVTGASVSAKRKRSISPQPLEGECRGLDCSERIKAVTGCGPASHEHQAC